MAELWMRYPSVSKARRAGKIVYLEAITHRDTLDVCTYLGGVATMLYKRNMARGRPFIDDTDDVTNV